MECEQPGLASLLSSLQVTPCGQAGPDACGRERRVQCCKGSRGSRAGNGLWISHPPSKVKGRAAGASSQGSHGAPLPPVTAGPGGGGSVRTPSGAWQAEVD